MLAYFFGYLFIFYLNTVNVVLKVLSLSGSYLGIELHSKDRYVVLRMCGGGNAYGRAALWRRQPSRSDVSDNRYSRHAATGDDSQKSRESSLIGNPTLYFLSVNIFFL